MQFRLMMLDLALPSSSRCGTKPYAKSSRREKSVLKVSEGGIC